MEAHKTSEVVPVLVAHGDEDDEAQGTVGGDLLTIIEAAERLAVGPRFVRRLIAERRIRYFKIGRHIRIASSDLEAWILARGVEPTSRR